MVKVLHRTYQTELSLHRLAVPTGSVRVERLPTMAWEWAYP